jgi:hypothetical protein
MRRTLLARLRLTLRSGNAQASDRIPLRVRRRA